MEHLFVSDITDSGFRLSWTSDEDMFDRFVVKIRDGKRLAHPQEFAVRGDERTTVVTGLMSGTEYEIELYGVALDKRSQPVTGVAHTGTWKQRPSFLLTTQTLSSLFVCDVFCQRTKPTNPLPLDLGLAPCLTNGGVLGIPAFPFGPYWFSIHLMLFLLFCPRMHLLR